jgi:hypothetical protein
MGSRARVGKPFECTYRDAILRRGRIERRLRIAPLEILHDVARVAHRDAVVDEHRHLAARIELENLGTVLGEEPVDIVVG